MSKPLAQKDELATRVWKLMFDYLMSTNPQRTDALERRGLTPNDSRALMSLAAGEGRPIGELAREWHSDPSNATWIVDRLEKAGLVERQPSPTDRRVKLVALTELGAATRRDLMAEFLAPPAELAAMGAADLAALEGLLMKLRPPRG